MSRMQIWAIVVLFALSPLVVLYIYHHQQRSKEDKPHRKHVVIDYLERDSASMWAKVVHHKSIPALVKSKNKSNAHYIYEFKIKNRRYSGKVYEYELHAGNAPVQINDSIRIVYSKSDPFFNVPHLILDDLKD